MIPDKVPEHLLQDPKDTIKQCWTNPKFKGEPYWHKEGEDECDRNQ